MARPFVLLSLLVLALVAGALASARTSASAGRVACGAKAIDAYFWPHGHPSIPAYNFPAFKPAHEEIYRKGATAKSGFLAFASAGEEILAKGCKKVRGRATKWGGGPIRAVRTSRRIRCSFPQNVEFRLETFPGRHELVVALGHTSKAVVHTDFKARSSLLYYDTRYCTDAAVPGVR
jgi:hypothetical protein